MKLLPNAHDSIRENPDFFRNPRIIDGCEAWPYETVQGDIVWVWGGTREDIEDAANEGDKWQFLALDIYGEVVCVDISPM